MTLLVDELLLLSRLGEGEDLQNDDVDLADLVINAVNDAAVAAPTHQWVKDLPDEPVWVRGDHARLHQLVSNLLSNARLHTPPGVTVTTAITRRRTGAEGACAELTVADDGPGIDGLAIVSSIVKAHHGSAIAESADGRTVFRVRLPMIESPISDSK
jgi:two-component system sensor histidine kinase TrcS